MNADDDALQLLRGAHAYILSGGRASRAGGANKSFIRIEGRTILEHQLERLRGVFGNRITIITDRPEDYAEFGLRCEPDLAGMGASEKASLVGIATALALEPEGWRFVLANDMPFPDGDLVVRQAEQAARDLRTSAVCIGGPKGAEPFHALYHSRLLDSARLAIGRGEFSLRAWLGAAEGVRVMGEGELGKLERWERGLRCLMNVNEAEDRPQNQSG